MSRTSVFGLTGSDNALHSVSLGGHGLAAWVDRRAHNPKSNFLSAICYLPFHPSLKRE
ncbi:MAG TPA: hypothetical protein VN857_11640 [Chthoniobacterales bacterium]|nr:hypothetical protein [Chthoniobacterales bacterium]